MALARDVIHSSITEGWRDFIRSMEQSLEMLERDIEDTIQLADACTAEWCQVTEHVLDELSNILFSISEPRWSSEEDSRKLKALKRRLHDAYAKYKSAPV
jgi:hypothetical protein